MAAQRKKEIQFTSDRAESGNNADDSFRFFRVFQFQFLSSGRPPPKRRIIGAVIRKGRRRAGAVAKFALESETERGGRRGQF